MKGTEGLVEALEIVVRDYQSRAEEAKLVEGKLYVPAGASVDSNVLMGLIREPDQITSHGNDGTEPAYTSLGEGNMGRNFDGTDHPNYIVIDVNLGEVVGLVNREGKTQLPRGFVVSKHLSGHSSGRGGYGVEGAIKMLRPESGNWVLVDNKGGIYASISCRCGCFDGEVFYSENDAVIKSHDMNSRYTQDKYIAQQITTKFLMGLRKSSQERQAKRDADHAREELRIAELQEQMPGVDYRKLEESLKGLPTAEKQRIIDSAKKTAGKKR